MPDYSILDFGARGDGEVNDATAIQNAVDACHSSGGGRVIIPAGKIYRTGEFHLKSNVEFHIERGAVIKASIVREDYRTGRPLRVISAEGAENIAITGGGIIDGCGNLYMSQELPYIYRKGSWRPFTVKLSRCRNVTVRDVVIRNGAAWTLVLEGCEDAVIHGIRLLNDLKIPNDDGIDICNCRNVRISGCHIEAGDDAICLKSTSADLMPCENITVTGCTLVSTSCALIIGCEVHQPIRNVIFDSCVVSSSHRGLGIHLSQECDVENVLFSNLIVETRLFHEDWWGRAEPIYVVAIPWTPETKLGRIRRVRFNNILCRGENSVFLYGWDKDRIEDVLFENVRIEMDKWSKWPGGRYDLRPYPDEDCTENILLAHDNSCFYLKNASRVTLRNCEAAWGGNRPEYFKHALESHNVAGLSLENFKGEAAHPGRDAAILTD
ncbi:MAG: glycoside hydrolase family 28 protein [Bacillota bacterium]